MPREEKKVDAMELQRQMVMNLLGSVSGEFKESAQEVKLEVADHTIDNDGTYDKSNSNSRSDSSSNQESDSDASMEEEKSSRKNIKDGGTLKESIEDMVKRAQQFTKLNSTESKIDKEFESQNDATEQNYPSVTTVQPLNFSDPKIIADYGEHFEGNNNFTKGCKWSPDGEYLLSLASDQTFRLFKLEYDIRNKLENDQCYMNTMSTTPLRMTEGELVYDFQWYPHMRFEDCNTCCFVTACRGMPVHLWNINTGKISHSYRPFNHLDEIAPAYSLGFSRDGCKLICGFKKTIRYFQTERPGRQCTTICAKQQNGVISCFDFHPHLPHIFAAGSYLGNVGVYSTNTNKVFSILEGQRGGITQLLFSEDGYRLYSGARRDSELLCWDIRNFGKVLSCYERTVDTNQRIAFALSTDQNNLISGSTNGKILSWDTSPSSPLSVGNPLPPTHALDADTDCINGVSVHPSLPLLASSSGQRRTPSTHHGDHDDDDEPMVKRIKGDNGTVKLWSLK